MMPSLIVKLLPSIVIILTTLQGHRRTPQPTVPIAAHFHGRAKGEMQLQSSAPWEGHRCRAGSDCLHDIIAW